MNWELAHDLARQAAVAEGDPSVSQRDTREVGAAFSAAEAWLDGATDLPSAGGPSAHGAGRTGSRTHLARWRTLAEPVATSVADRWCPPPRTQAPDAVDAFNAQGAGSGGQMMRQLGGAVFGMQVGQAAGTLAREVFGCTDIGLPLIEGPASALVPRNVAEFAKGLDVPVEEVRLYLALREAAHARLFTHVTWLRGHLLGRGRGLRPRHHDRHGRPSRTPSPPSTRLTRRPPRGALRWRVRPGDHTRARRRPAAPGDPARAGRGLGRRGDGRRRRPHLPHTAALREMIRRRRAAGGPAEDTFATLVGLELRPRRSRDAAGLWA